MASPSAWTAAALLIAAHAAGQTVLYGVRGNGDLIRIDAATGAGLPFGSSAAGCGAGTAGAFWGVATGGGPAADQLHWLNSCNGAVYSSVATTGRPTGYTIRGMAGAAWPRMYVMLGAEGATTIDLLAWVDTSSGAYTVIGPTGRTDLGAIAMSPAGALYALGSYGGGMLYTLDVLTGQATLVGGGDFSGDDLALGFLPDGTLLACGSNLRAVNITNGVTTLVGPTGFTDVRALAAVPGCFPQPMQCYADCDDTPWTPPRLSVIDFLCFLNKFAAGDAYTNCDLSTTPPVLNVLDFICFLNRFAAGCS